jgi:NADPH:quinone reductase-like Zn-dependent oxidoreductase
VRHTRIIVTHYGGPDSLRVVEEECPKPKDGEVRVRVLAAGVSLPDLLMREGVHPETPRLPFTPGWDLIGVVDKVGGGLSGIEPGQIVAALPIHGAYAEFVCLPQRELVPVPSGLDAAEVVSLILNYITAYQMLHRSAKVRPGQRMLIHGAAVGLGPRYCSWAASPGWRCTVPVHREGRRPFLTWAVSLLITSVRTS